jgi:predicted porin
MKKKLLAVAVVGALASPVAFAQTLYGIVDLGYQNSKYADGDVNKHFIQEGQHSGSRFGVRGSEDLAGGTYAMYQLEMNMPADTGAAVTLTRLGMVGLGSKAWGELTLGRQYTHTFHTFAVGSASGYGTFSSFYNASTTGIMTRASNSVKYSSPVMGGFSVGAIWAPGEDTTPGEKSNNNYMDVAVRYTPGPFGVALSHARTTVQTGGVDEDLEQTQITANWDNRAWGIYGGYMLNKFDALGAELDVSSYWINPVMRFGGRHEVYFLWGQVKDDSTGVTEADSTVIALTYQHVMSKRTRIYTSIGRVSNDANAGVALNGQAGTTGGFVGTAGFDPRGFQLGLLHSF